MRSHPHVGYLLLASFTVIIVGAACFDAANTVLGPMRSTIVIGLGVIQIACLGMLVFLELRPSEQSSGESAERPLAGDPASDEAEVTWDRPVAAPEPLTPAQRTMLIYNLDDHAEFVRLHAIQTLVDRENTPIAQIQCWPENRCSDLQLTTAETLLREWGEEVLARPNATEKDLIQALFTEEPLDREPRIRMLPQPYPDPPVPVTPPPAAESPDLLNAAMDRLHNAVKDTILDWNPEVAAEDAEPEEEVPLCPLDCDRFAAGMIDKFDEVLEHITETVSTPRTNLDLAKTETEVGRFLHELRWDALNLALELRVPIEAEAGPSRSAAPFPHPHLLPREKPAVPSSGGWAKKYRRMRALGY